ncbi:MAG: redoxin family protein [Bacteroidota bacterium]
MASERLKHSAGWLPCRMWLCTLLVLLSTSFSAVYAVTASACDTDETATGKVVAVYVFLSPECPICQQYSATLNKIVALYRDKPVTVCGVVPGLLYSAKDIADFRVEYNISFPVITDSLYRLTTRLQATITPQAILLDEHGATVYSGPVDNTFVALGRKRAHTTAHYLTDALDSTLAGKPVAMPSVPAVGCRIERANINDSQ